MKEADEFFFLETLMPVYQTARYHEVNQVNDYRVLPRRWNQQVSLKCLYLSTKVHDVTSEMAVILIFSAVGTWLKRMTH
jgi:hypothetical protein